VLTTHPHSRTVGYALAQPSPRHFSPPARCTANWDTSLCLSGLWHSITAHTLCEHALAQPGSVAQPRQRHFPPTQHNGPPPSTCPDCRTAPQHTLLKMPTFSFHQSGKWTCLFWTCLFRYVLLCATHTHKNSVPVLCWLSCCLSRIGHRCPSDTARSVANNALMPDRALDHNGRLWRSGAPYK
jgi:hypothetical protein